MYSARRFSNVSNIKRKKTSLFDVRRLCMSMGPIKNYHLRVAANKCICFQYNMFAFFLPSLSLLPNSTASKAISLRCLNALSNVRHNKKKQRRGNRLPTYFITSPMLLNMWQIFTSNTHLCAHCINRTHNVRRLNFYDRRFLLSLLILKPQQIKIALLSVSMIECALKTNENKRERQVHIFYKMECKILFTDEHNKKTSFRLHISRRSNANS